LTPEDLNRIESKLDAIIDYFNIGKKAPRNLQVEIDKKFIELTSPRQKRKRKE
jgi:hypothetical protein